MDCIYPMQFLNSNSRLSSKIKIYREMHFKYGILFQGVNKGVYYVIISIHINRYKTTYNECQERRQMNNLRLKLTPIVVWP